MKINCDIFRDLFPSYIRGEITDETKRFVDEHLEECSVCKSILDDMTNDVKEENNNTIERKEIKGLKKINRQMIILKCIILLLVIVIISSLGIVGLRKYKTYKNGIVVCNIIKTAYGNAKKIQESNNFILTTNTNNISSTFYYKDGKYKQTTDYSKTMGTGCTLSYGKTDNDNKFISIDFWEYCNLITVSKRDNFRLATTWTTPDEALEDLISLEPMDFENCIIDEDKYNNIPCYIIKRKDGNFIYECLYFNKNNNSLLRREKFNYKNEITSCLEFTHSTGTVTDEDLKIKDISGYEINTFYDRYDYNKISYDEAINYLNEFK